MCASGRVPATADGLSGIGPRWNMPFMAFHSGAQRCAENISVRPGWPTRLSAGHKGLGQTRISLTWLAGRTVVISATTIPFILSEFVFMSRIGPFSKSQTVRFDKPAAISGAAALPSGSRGPASCWSEGSGAPLAVGSSGSDPCRIQLIWRRRPAGCWPAAWRVSWGPRRQGQG